MGILVVPDQERRLEIVQIQDTPGFAIHEWNLRTRFTFPDDEVMIGDWRLEIGLFV